MNYAVIDKSLEKWTELKGILVQRKYRDDEVRSFNVWSNDNTVKAQDTCREHGVNALMF